MLQGKHITFSYPEPAKGKTDVLADVSFEIREHDFIGLIGASGSGKTTFLNAMSNYIPKDERVITIEDSAELQIKGV